MGREVVESAISLFGKISLLVSLLGAKLSRIIAKLSIENQALCCF